MIAVDVVTPVHRKALAERDSRVPGDPLPRGRNIRNSGRALKDLENYTGLLDTGQHRLGGLATQSGQRTCLWSFVADDKTSAASAPQIIPGKG